LLNATQGWTRIDVIGRAIQQITASKELGPELRGDAPERLVERSGLTKDKFRPLPPGRSRRCPRWAARAAWAASKLVHPNIFGLDMS
jgi:hypothetical protein